MSVTKFASLLSSFDSMLIHPVSGIYPYNTLLLVITYQKEGGKATELLHSITGLLMPAYDCLWNNARGRNQDPNTLVLHHQLLTSILYKLLDAAWRWGRYGSVESKWQLGSERTTYVISTNICTSIFLSVKWVNLRFKSKNKLNSYYILFPCSKLGSFYLLCGCLL